MKIPPALLLAIAAFIMLCPWQPGAAAEAAPMQRNFLHSAFQDHMVLQRGVKAPVWGWTTPGGKVTVEFHGQTVTAVAGKDGKWLAALGPFEAGGPFDMKISGAGSATLKDVLIGDVWLCSGQSNMQGNLDKANNGDAIAKANVPTMRFMSLTPGNDNGSEVPMDDLWMTHSQWTVLTPESADKLSRTAYFFGRDLHDHFKVPIGLLIPSLNGSPIECWMPREAMMSLAPYEVDGQFYASDDPYDEIIPNWYLPSSRFNSLIHPLGGFALKGFLWYQGETNSAWRHEDDRYATLLQLMIRSWRACWGGEALPFITIQLPSTPRDKVLKETPRRSGWAEVQFAQMKSLQLPKTGVAICVDLGDGDLHPKTKDKIGARAALAARMVAYDEKIVGMGPTYRSMKAENGAIRVSFDNIGSGLISRDGEPLRLFLVAGEDKKFVWADARIDGSDVIVSSPQVARPAAVRHGWVQTAIVNLYNKEGLPASPFRTDQWNDPEGKTPRMKGPQGKGIAWDETCRSFPLSPLYRDVMEGNLAAVQAALQATPNALDQFNQDRRNVLNAAIAGGHTEVAALLLKSGVDWSLPELSGLYPIHRAAQYGRTDIAQMLLKAGAKPQTPARAPGDATPLFFAAKSNQPGMVKLLLDNGADPNAGRQSYRPGAGIETVSPLYAAFDKNSDGEAARLLIESGANFKDRFATGDYAIHLAVKKNLVNIVALLLEKGADVNQPNNKGDTPLDLAASEGAKKSVELLLSKGGKVTPKTLEAAGKRKDNADVLKLLQAAK